MPHTIARVRHEVKRRELTVKEILLITPNMIRITFGGKDLEGFVSPSPDDHVKLFFPTPAGEIEKRDYTPRRYDIRNHTLAIDFAIHEAGPATDWAMNAKIGDTIAVGGPKGSTIIPDDFDWWLLMGDETALPAIGRRLEMLPAGTRVTSIIAVTGKAEEQSFETKTHHSAIWVHRPFDQADNPEPLLSALKTVSFPEGDGFVWAAAEAKVARAVRDIILHERHHPLEWTKAAGYWVKGQADAHEKLER